MVLTFSLHPLLIRQLWCLCMCARARGAIERGSDRICCFCVQTYPLTVSSSNTISIPVFGRYPGVKFWHFKALRFSVRPADI